MHICFISPCQFNEFTGGIDRVCCQLIREFSKNKIVMTSCFLHHSKKNGVENVTHCQFPDSLDAMSYENIDYLHSLILDKQIDIVWLNSHVYGQWECVKRAVKGTSAKIVFTFHTDPVAPLVNLSDEFDYGKTNFSYNRTWSRLWDFLRSLLKFPVGYYLRRRYLKNNYRDIAKHGDLVTFLSNSAMQSFSALAGADIKAMLAVILNPIDLETEFRQAKKKQILFVGRLVWQKRVDRLLKAWRVLQNKFPDWSLVIVGDGSEKALFIQMTERMKLERVSFEGSQPSFGYYKNSSLLCVPSSHEGFCLVAFEALANGCIPVFFDSVHSLVDLLGYDNSVRAWSLGGLVKSLSLLMRNFKTYSYFAGDKKDVLQKLLPDKIAKQYIKLFESLII